MTISLVFMLLPTFFPILSGSNFGRVLGPFRNFGFKCLYLVSPLFFSLAAGYVFNYFKDTRASVFLQKTNKDYLFYIQNILISITLVLVVFVNFSIKTNHFYVWLKTGGYYANTHSPDVSALVDREKNSLPYRVAIISPKSYKSLYPFLSNFYGLETSDASTDVMPQRIDEFFRIMSNADTRTSQYFLPDVDSQTAKKMMTNFDLNNLVNTSLMSLFNVKFVLTDHIINSDGFELIQTPSVSEWKSWTDMKESEKIKLKLEENFFGKKLLVYENKNSFPRFFLAKKVEFFDTDNDLLNALSDADIKRLRETVFLLKQYTDKIPEMNGVDTDVDVIEYSNDKIKLKVETDGPSVLVISNNFTPFWEVYVDGVKKEIIPAYHALMAVSLERNNNEVELIYKPPYVVKL